MKLKKISLVLISFVILLLPMVVLADCSDCNTSNCGDCNCVLNSDSDKCIYSNYSDDKVSCGSRESSDEPYLDNIPSVIPKVTHIVYNIIEVAVPILLVLFCMIDLVKAVMAQKEDDIKKNQAILIKRMIAAIIVFILFILVKFVISIVADNSSGIMDCADCFISETCGD